MDKMSKRHTVTIYKNESGFGFNVRGQISEGGEDFLPLFY